MTTKNENFRDTLYTINKEGSRKWVYPEPKKGRYFHTRRIVAWILIVIYCGLPWLVIDGKQSVFLDIANRKLTFFGTTFWATDTFLLFCVIATLALSLFFFTALLGRMWCGWACPQTVFLEFVFRPIERLIEGRSAARMRRDLGPWNADKIWRKTTKLICFSVVAWLLASTALAYVIGREPLLIMMTGSPLSHPIPFLLTVLMMGVLLFEFGWFREQFCTLVCPYARFQSVLLDDHSRIVAYDRDRGEPRGKVRTELAPRGDCIDCGACVRVCPTGIDIRNGLQLECIHCTQCMDACDDIMSSLHRPLGLVRYTSAQQLSGKPRAIVRGRTVLYALLIVLVITAGALYLRQRTAGEFKITRGGSGSPFTILTDGRISNHMHLYLSNRGDSPIDFTVALVVPSDIELFTPIALFTVPPGQLKELPIFINFKPDLLKQGTLKSIIKVNGSDGSSRKTEIILLGPQ